MSARVQRGLAAFAAVVALAAGTSSCVDNRYAPPPQPIRVKASDLHGTWKGWAGSSLTLQPGGVAEVTDLDGQEFRFDDGWRMTGPGILSLSEPGSYKGGNTVGNGSVVHVTVNPVAKRPSKEAGPERSGLLASSPLPTDAATRTVPPPAEAFSDIGVVKDKSGRPALFFLTSDPDVRDTYYLSRS